MRLMEECILNLHNEADLKSNEAKTMEKAVLLMDDNSKREKFLLKQIVTSPGHVTEKTISLVLKRFKELIGSHLDLEGAIEFLTSLNVEIEKLDNTTIQEVELDQCLVPENDGKYNNDSFS